MLTALRLLHDFSKRKYANRTFLPSLKFFTQDIFIYVHILFFSIFLSTSPHPLTTPILSPLQLLALNQTCWQIACSYSLYSLYLLLTSYRACSSFPSPSRPLRASVTLLQLIKMLICASQCFSQQSSSIFAALYLENIHEFTVSVTVSALLRYADLEKPLQICHRAAIQVRAISCNDAEQHVSYVSLFSRSLVTPLDHVSGNVNSGYGLEDKLLLVLL